MPHPELVEAHVVDQARQVKRRTPASAGARRPAPPARKRLSDDAAEKLLGCAMMDSNNFEENVGVGEREAVLSGVVRRRHFGLAHGVGARRRGRRPAQGGR